MAKRVKVTRFVCPACGGTLVAVPKALRCTQCGYEKSRVVEPIEPNPRPLEEKEACTELKLFECPSCGAVSQSDSVSLLCPYCSTPLVGEFFNPLPPFGVGTIWVDPKKVAGLLKAHIRSLWFAPNAFIKGYQKAKSPKAFYYPIWSFNAYVRIYYDGWRGVRHSRIVYVNNQPQTRTTMEWEPVSGVVELMIEDIQQLGYPPIDSSMERLHWNARRLEVVHKEALSGWESKEYHYSPLEARRAAQPKFDAKMEWAIRRDIGGDAQRIDRYKSEYLSQEFVYFLAPFYHIQIHWRKRHYDFFIDAQSGTVVGERPYSWIKIALFILLVLGGVAALYFLDQWMQTHHHISLWNLL